MLPVNYTFKSLDENEKSFLRNYIKQKIKRIKNLLWNYIEEDCRLEIKTEKFATKAAYKIEFILHLPNKKLMAVEDDHTINEAVDLALDKLTIQLRKLKK